MQYPAPIQYPPQQPAAVTVTYVAPPAGGVISSLESAGNSLLNTVANTVSYITHCYLNQYLFKTQFHSADFQFELHVLGMITLFNKVFE